MSLEEEKPLRGWINIALIAQFYILDVSATAKYNIPYTPQHGQTIAFSMRNTMVLQVDSVLMYLGRNMFMYPGFYKLLMQGHILVIPDLGFTTVLSPLIAPPMIAGMVDDQ